MTVKKSIKKVEISDDSVVDLKSKKKSITDFGFHVRPIDDEPFGEMDREEPVIDNKTSEVMDKNSSDRYSSEELHRRMESFAEKLERAVIKVAPEEGNVPENVAAKPKDLIKVKFEKFVQLVATKDFLSVLERNADEDIIMSSNLLTELASAVDDKGEKKSPVFFLVGLALGVILTYLLVNY